MDLKIITPERTVLETENVRHVLLPAEDGQLGILPRHMPILCSLQVGRMRVDLPDESVHLATSGGFAEVLNDRITVLADTAEKAVEIDVERARRARQRAEERLRKREEHLDLARARAALARALNRLHIAGAE